MNNISSAVQGTKIVTLKKFPPPYFQLKYGKARWGESMKIPKKD